MSGPLAKIQIRRGLSSQWSQNNPEIVLSPGEIGYEIDTGKFKIGGLSGTNGILTKWNELPYANTSDSNIVRTTGNQTISGNKTFSGVGQTTTFSSNLLVTSPALPIFATSGIQLTYRSPDSDIRVTLSPNLSDNYGWNNEAQFVTPTVLFDFDQQTSQEKLHVAYKYKGLSQFGTAQQVKTDLSLNNVQNLALSGITFTAGSGLTGGGNLSANRTFDVGGGDGIVIGTTGVSVNTSVVRTTGNQSISGVKTFIDANFLGSIDANSLNANNLNIKNGTISVTDDNSSFVTTISSTGLNVYDTSVTNANNTIDINRVIDGSSFDYSAITSNTGIIFGRIGGLNKTALFINFNDPKNNGLYVFKETIPKDEDRLRIERLQNYQNDDSWPNNFIVNVTKPLLKSYILNSGVSGSSTIGTDNLIFTDITDDFTKSAVVVNQNASVDVPNGLSTTILTAEAKYFKIKHPDPESFYQYLQYGSLESPYNGIRLTGCGKLIKGECIVQLPSYIKHLVHEQDISIQLTNKSHHKILYVDSVNINSDNFIVKGYRSKTGGPYEFYWSFTGVRKDVGLLVPEF